VAHLELENIAHHYPGASLEGISFALEPGSVGVLVGASGSGKTTILKLIAGFLRPQQGSIRIAGQPVSTPQGMLAPHKRGVGLVFQQHALLPHLTARQNILFGAAGKPAQRHDTAEKLMADFHISALAERYPHQLSGGEAQRVALARALAAGPSVLLMDEPFSSIDIALRRHLRLECIEALRKAGITTLLVTHDPEEAMELADRIMVLHHGHIAQMGSPHGVYFRPASREVAALFGEINHLSNRALIERLTGTPEDELLLRPESILLCPVHEGVNARIQAVHYRGNHSLVRLLLDDGTQLKAHTHEPSHIMGETVGIRLSR
jgi:iron(III) transport system ATP-binding protein